MDNPVSLITKLLEIKHHDACFVTQCKTGSTYYSNFSQFDCWVLEKSWAHPRTIGYEIKVSRSDFLNDKKFTNYFDYCNELYFVAPDGIIGKDEVPENCGLMVASKNLKRLITKKKAPYREIDEVNLVSLFKYILFFRTQIIKENKPQDKVKFWEEWLMEKEEKKRLGVNVSKKIRDYVKNIEKENDELKRENDKLEIVKQAANDLGIDLYKISTFSSTETIKRMFNSNHTEIKKQLDELNNDINFKIRNIKTYLDKM